jgi:CBS domain-containing protein
MQTVREAMTHDVRHVPPGATVLDAAREMADGDIGALPVCDDDGRLEGIITDRDIAIRVVAAGMDPSRTQVSEAMGSREVVSVGADDDVQTAIAMMKRHAVRRMPVVDGERVVGMLSQADVAADVGAEEAGDMVRTISTAPGNTAEGP